MSIQNVVICDQNPTWVGQPWKDDPTAEKQLAMWRELARECPHRWGGLTFRITVQEGA
jgi:hypothetical protein